MELQVSNFKGIATAVLRQATRKVSDGVDKLVCNVEQKLIKRISGSQARTVPTYIFDLGVDFNIGVNTRDKVLYRSSHALVARRVPLTRSIVIQIQHSNILWCPAYLRGRTYRSDRFRS